MTEAQAATLKRQQRIIEKFKELTEAHPEIAPSRICDIIADGEKKRTDGVKTLMGVKKIIKKHGLWKPTKLFKMQA